MSYALRIRIMHHSAAPARGRAMDYALRIRIMHHSAAPARGRAMYYALRIRIMYQAPKARRRGHEMRPAPRLKYGSQAHRSQSSPALNAWVL